MTRGATSEVGFVVIGRNEGPRLEQCLRSVLAVSAQVIYADSASSDGSDDRAQKLGVAVTRLTDDGRLSAARGRNAGYAELQSRFPDCEFVMFIDGDCILQPDFMSKAIAWMRDHSKAAVVCGQRFEAYPRQSIYNALCDQEWNTPVGRATECGGDAVVRRSALDEVGGYRSDLRAGEEPEMTARMRAAGWEIWRIDARMTEHDARILNLRQWWRRTQRGGFGYAQVWSATRSLPQRIYAKQLRSAFAWAIGFPALVILAAVMFKAPLALLAIPLGYAVQLARIAARSQGAHRGTKAALILLAKFPEAGGALRFFLTGNSRNMAEYKALG